MPLPIELVECIIDASVTDLPTLTACSLVCKQWLPRCRHHLFSSLNLSADWTPEPNSVTEFLALLPAPHATITPYVRAVVLSKRSWGMTPVARILAALAHAGVHPRALFVNCPTYEPTHAPLFAASLTHLVLELHNDMPAARLIEHVCAFPRLESLDVGGSARFSFDGDVDDDDEVTGQLSPRLHTLIVRNTVVVEWLISREEAVHGITTLVIKQMRLAEQWAGVERYLTSACAKEIRTLAFHGCDFTAIRTLHLDLLTNLQTLTVECTPAAIPAHLALLRHLPIRPALEHLEVRFMNALIGLSTTATAVGDPATWGAADERLGDTRCFPVLRRVCVGMGGWAAGVVLPRTTSEGRNRAERSRGLPWNVAELVKREMPRCVARGVLVV